MKNLYRFFASLYIEERFYWLATSLAVLFILSHWVAVLFVAAQVLLAVFCAFIIADAVLLFGHKKSLSARRQLPERLSNGDVNLVSIYLENHTRRDMVLEIIDELPVQFQKRDFLIRDKVLAGVEKRFTYEVTPVERGEYIYGRLNIYLVGKWQLLKRRWIFDAGQSVACYPSFIHLRKYELMAIVKQPRLFGFKKIRRIGHTMEFEQIKDYVVGDDFRTINWKATAKASKYMVNQYQDETSQPVYSVIDMGRVMKMPFENLKLLDYAINASLAFSKITLQKKDKAGLITFSDKVHNVLEASGKSVQMHLLMEQLYQLDTNFAATDFGRLRIQLQYQLTQRSLLMLYTNFEHISALQRQLPYLKAIAKRHLLVIIIFENTEVKREIQSSTDSLWGIYQKSVAEKFELEKKTMIHILRSHNIQALLTTPKNLTVNVINKYLEIKAKGQF